MKEAVDEHCHFDEDAAEILQSAFDDYNPFCNVSSNEEGRRSASAMKQVGKNIKSTTHISGPPETLMLWNTEFAKNNIVKTKDYVKTEYLNQQKVVF